MSHVDGNGRKKYWTSVADLEGHPEVLALQERKRELADALFAGEGRGLRELTREDLEWVLS